MSSFLDSWIEFIQGMGRVMSPMPATHPISITMNGFISFINYGARGVPTLPQGCEFVSIRIFCFDERPVWLDSLSGHHTQGCATGFIHK
jgi:hypothetical protein